jgi:hypothetical protein
VDHYSTDIVIKNTKLASAIDYVAVPPGSDPVITSTTAEPASSKQV